MEAQTRYLFENCGRNRPGCSLQESPIMSQAKDKLAIWRDTTVMWWLIPARSHISGLP